MKSELDGRGPGFRVSLLSVGALLIAATALTGCHRQHTYRPPSLRHSGPFTDLASIRAGNQVSITWAMPQKTEDKFAHKGFETLHICRREVSASACTEVAEPIRLAAGTSGTFSEMLPPELDRGTPRILIYYVEASDRESRSNLVLGEVATIAGNPPPPFRGLTAQLQKGGVLLRWTPVTDTQQSEATYVRVYRWSRAPEQDDTSQSPVLSAGQSESFTLSASADAGMVLDKSARRGKSYEYEAQLVTQVKLKERTLELTGELSAPVCVDDVLKPDVNLSAAEPAATIFAEGSCPKQK